MNLLLLVVAAYLIGSLSFAVIVSKLMGLDDPRTYGSNNPGATNVLRSGNKKAAALTLLGDALKGLIAVILAQWMAPKLGYGNQAIAICTVATTVGHMWPVFFNFKGGKGVATALGILLALNIWMGLGLLAIWLFMAKVVKISSLSALTAASFAPVFAWFLLPNRDYFIAICIIVALLIWRHKQNIMGLITGKESKISVKTDSEE